MTYARRADLGAGTAFTAELRRLGVRFTNTYVNADDSLPNLDAFLASDRQHGHRGGGFLREHQLEHGDRRSAAGV